MKKEKEVEHVELSLLLTYFHIGLLSLLKVATKGLFTWSGGSRSSGVGFFLFSRSGGHKTKETYPTRLGSPTPCKQGLIV